MQAKMLSVLQNREVFQLGSTSMKKVNVRVLCATNLTINQLLDDSHFRQDLLYRINTVEIQVPALRDRKEDIPELFEYFKEIYEKKYSTGKLSVHPNTIDRIMMYSWPGNIRELQHATERNHHSGNDFETWINFSKIISHEILNSISPIISLTSTLQTKLDKIEGNIQTTESMRKALKIIQDRCNSLQIYSEKYRTLQRLPEPKKEVLKWSNIINKSLELNKEQLINCNINYKVSGESLEDVFKADSWQMDKIFSNLILNSIQSLNNKKSSNKEIEINVSAKSLYYIVTYTDNGVGIHKDIRANVFTHFFTTRESGSGIGLSVIKKILWKHNAEIFLQDVDEGASFLMKFQKIN